MRFHEIQIYDEFVFSNFHEVMIFESSDGLPYEVMSDNSSNLMMTLFFHNFKKARECFFCRFDFFSH